MDIEKFSQTLEDVYNKQHEDSQNSVVLTLAAIFGLLGAVIVILR